MKPRECGAAKSKRDVDTAQTTHISLCSGYGGIDLGLRRCIPSLRTVAYAEIEAFAIELLLARMEGGQLDAAPIWPDLRSFPWESFRDRVDVLSGGYPCQPFSAAGKRLGADDERHLWPAIAAGIRILRPRICFFENVEGHISLGLREVVDELGAMGYRATWGIFSASEVGAPHQRKRVFILAYREGAGLEGHDRLFAGCGQSRWHVSEQARPACWSDSGGDVWPSRPGEPQHGWEPPRVVADTGRDGGGRRSAVGGVQAADDGAQGEGEGSSCSGRDEAGQWQECELVCSGAEPAMGDTSGSGQPQWGSGTMGRPEPESQLKRPDCHGYETKRKTQPEVGGDADGIAGGLGYAELCISSDNRTDELRLLGNGVVPATAARAFAVLMEELLS